MSSTSTLYKHIGTVTYRFGKLSAERKDLQGSPNETGFENGGTKQSVHVNLSTDTDSIRAEIRLMIDAADFEIEVITACSWEIFDSAPDDDGLKRSFAQTVALPRLIAVAESEAASLARRIDVPIPVFAFELDRKIIESQLTEAEK